MLKKYRYLFLVICALLSASEGWAYEIESPVSQQASHSYQNKDIISYVNQNLPLYGILEQASDGYVYVKVTNRYVYNLFPMLKVPDFMMPGSIRRHTKIGAHISVFYENEMRKIGYIPEIGEKYYFIPQRIQRINGKNKDYLILEVKAPELEKLRKYYGLSSKLMGHEFHITLAEKYVD